ncbi:MAG: family 20 glycosylhydrolase [Armatimonadetes bacterium]|nr:family 20 glycosylhydrolase [Armatimonadota bacterium]
MAIQKNWPIFLSPTPARVQPGGGEIDLSDGWRLECQAAPASGLLPEYQAALEIPMEGDGKPVRLVEAEMAPEAYRIEVLAHEATLSAGTERGFRHALRTLRQMGASGRLPLCTIEDAPQMGVRGFHTRIHPQMDAAAVRRLIEIAGRFGLNTLLLEYDAYFPYRRHARVRDRKAFSPEEVAELVGLARRQGIEVVPLQQSLGHLEYLLRHDAYAALREEDTARAQMCPLNPAAFETFVELAEDLLALHPGTRFLHVGADETYHLGACPRCRQRVAEVGRAGLYGAYLEKVLRWVIGRGLRPIIWDDMLCEHPEALDYIPRETVIMYWEYWTMADPSPYFVARFRREKKPVIICDERWGREWPLEPLPEVQRRAMDYFARPVPLPENLGEEFLARYGAYLGPDFPKFIRPFPYLEYYQDQGFDVLAAPAATGTLQKVFGLPHLELFFRNIHAFAARCRENGKSLGMVTTSWYPFPPELLHESVAVTGQFTWSAEP